MQVASMLLGLISAQRSLISHCTAKLPFYQKAMAVMVIVNLACIKDCEEWRKGAYAQDKWNIQANPPSPLLP